MQVITVSYGNSNEGEKLRRDFNELLKSMDGVWTYNGLLKKRKAVNETD